MLSGNGAKITWRFGMEYTRADRREIYDRTGGYCHLCHRKMYFSNYGVVGRRGAWEIDHSRPVAIGGADHRNNLFAAHISCNRSKGAATSRTARAWHGEKRAPKSRAKRREEKSENRFLLGALGIGLALLIGAAIKGAGGQLGDPAAGQ